MQIWLKEVAALASVIAFSAMMVMWADIVALLV
jgi:hypothetical protein